MSENNKVRSRAANQSILAAGVEHLRLDLGAVGAPDNEEELVANTAVSECVLEIEDGIDAVVLGNVNRDSDVCQPPS